MLKSIADALFSFIDIVVSICKFVIDFISDIGYLIENLIKLPEYFDGGLMSILPTTLITALVSGVAVVIVLRVLGRD